MKFADVLELGFLNLRQARLRTVLTTLGVAIGVAALVGMVSLGAGLQDNLNTRLLNIGFFKSITVFPQGESRTTSQAPRVLDDVALAAMRQIPGVKRVEADIRLPLRVEINDKNSNAMAVAVPMESADEAAFKEMTMGKFFSSEDAAEIILNTEAARNLGFTNPAGLVGQTVKTTVSLRPPGRGAPAGPPVPELPQLHLELRVVGLVTRERAVFGNIGSQVYLPFKTAQEQQKKIFDRFPMAGAFFRGFNSVTVRLESARDLDRVEKTIDGLGFRTISISSAISQLRRVFLVVDMLLAFVGSIGLTVACLGITNTMVMAVLERTREIGVMKAVGAEDQDIRRLFLAESAVIGGAGGVLGLCFAWVLGRSINAGANFYFVRQGFQPENLFIIPLWLVASAIAFSVLVSIGSCLYPAARAARIDPTRALRHD